MSTQKFVDGAGRTGEFWIIIIMHDDNSLPREARNDEFETGFNRTIEVAVKKGESNLLG